MDLVFDFIDWVGADNIALFLFGCFWLFLIFLAGKEQTGGLGNQR